MTGSEAQAAEEPLGAGPLARMEAATRMLAEARTVDEVKDVRDRAEALRLYTRQRGYSLEAQNHCAEIKLRAERRIGELLAEQVRHEGGRPEKPSHDTTVSAPPRLADYGISRDQSSRFQQVAAIPPPVFEGYLRDTKEQGEELTTAGLLRAAEDAAEEAETAGDGPAPGPSDAECLEIVDRVLGPDPNREQRDRRLRLYRFLGESAKLLALEPDPFVPSLAGGDRTLLRSHIISYRKWCDRWEAALDLAERPGLRVIGEA